MMEEIRQSIEQDRFADYKREFLEGYLKGENKAHPHREK
jgi:queuine/archaeosine tRNA-ribosyltransferase